MFLDITIHRSIIVVGKSVEGGGEALGLHHEVRVRVGVAEIVRVEQMPDSDQIGTIMQHSVSFAVLIQKLFIVSNLHHS